MSTLFKALLLLLPAMALFLRSIKLFSQSKRADFLLELLGAGFLVLVVAAHLAEETHSLAGMGWGLPNTTGHYLDLSSAVLGVVLLSLGLFLEAMAKRREKKERAFLKPRERQGLECKKSYDQVSLPKNVR